jgi:catechol 2,3-dioxygenase
VRPLYLSHVLLFSADVARARAFYEDVLGLRLSDHAGSVIAFLHTPHGSDHHLLALAQSDGGGLHHSSWCVDALDDVGLGMEQMVAAGYPDGWGVGRHVLGSNYFRYVRDPWGSFVEYSFDIDFIAPGQEWPAADHPAHDSLYVWGPALPADFVTNHESAQRRAAAVQA